MSKKTIVTGILVDENAKISFVEVCKQYDISKEMIQEMIEHGFFEEHPLLTQQAMIDQRTSDRIRSAHRLEQDLGINIPGVVLVLELLEEMEQIKNELHILRHHVDR